MTPTAVPLKRHGAALLDAWRTESLEETWRVI